MVCAVSTLCFTRNADNFLQTTPEASYRVNLTSHACQCILSSRVYNEVLSTTVKVSSISSIWGADTDMYMFTSVYLLLPSQVIDRLKPIPVVRFASHVAAMHHDRDKGFELEYQVRLLPAMKQECAVQVYNSDCVCVSTCDYFQKDFYMTAVDIYFTVVTLF